MQKDLTELVFILDKSGSMQGLENDTIGGFNSLIEKQKNILGEAVVSTVLFNNKHQVLHDRINISEVAMMTGEEYYVGGCTALLDAVGYSINHIINIRKKTPKSEHPGKTMFVITTDGKENASTKYDYSKIKKMIEFQKEKYGWEFIFLGANIDVSFEARRMGLRRENSVAFKCDSIGIDLCYEGVSDAIEAFRTNKCLHEIPWQSKIVDDCKNRK